jgi:glyceraldehyde 3-phosphate dehydrogenase
MHTLLLVPRKWFFQPLWVDSKTVVLRNDDILDGPKPLYRMQVAQRIMLHLWWKWLMNFGIEQAYITTIHSYTTDQSLYTINRTKIYVGQCGAVSMVPTTTGVQSIIVFSIRRENRWLRYTSGSRRLLTDITFNVKRIVSIVEINAASQNSA